MFPCLWGEVADKLSTVDDRARALAPVKSEDFLRTVQSFRRNEGIAPHPAVAYRILADKEKKQSKFASLEVPPRASTPRKKRKASAGVERKKLPRLRYPSASGQVSGLTGQTACAERAARAGVESSDVTGSKS